MKKSLLLSLCLVLGFVSVNAAHIDLSTAQKVAGSFTQTTINTELRAADLNLVLTTPEYYVFNVSSEGFVIVSSDDSFRPIIGYSDEGVFDAENPSPEMMYYLNSISEGRRAALRSSISADTQTVSEWTALLNGEKMPARNRIKKAFHLVQTKWNQGSPYNKFCPHGQGGRSYAGCVATAMSQVMNYWKYPTHGYGQHTYVHRVYGEISADFSSAEYDFDAMGLSINDMSTPEQIDPIAFFMYHCGIAVDMDYSPDGSGAYSQDVPESVMKYFNYSNRCRYYARDNGTIPEFMDILKDQFDLGWPCYYSGSDVDGQGGHAFVCDGYDDADMFHFNWGWGGSGDGFFIVENLDVSSYAFNNGQAIVMNYVPGEVMSNTAKAPDAFHAVPNGDMEFSVSLSWTNPTMTLDGFILETIDQIVITRDGQVVKTFDNPVPGESMSYVDIAGLPILVDYSIYAVCNGYGGRRAHVNGLNLGPTCPWTVKMHSSDENGWGTGAIKVQNSAGVESAVYSAKGSETEETMELPQGWVTLMWTAPNEDIEIGFEILDSEDNVVFSFEGLSSLMPKGIFYEVVNTCGGNGMEKQPSDLHAQVEGEDVVLQWTGVADPGYGYNIYRDGCLYTMVPDTTAFVDEGAALSLHSYYVTVFGIEGESEASNIVSAVMQTEEPSPRNLDLAVLENGKLDLRWEAPENAEGLKGYFIYQKLPGEDFKVYKPMGANTTHLTLPSNLALGCRYDYKVVALYGQDYTESSPAPSLNNPDMLYVEANLTHLPYNLTLQVEDGMLVLNWAPGLLAESYNVYCNDELVAEELTETSWTRPMASEGEVLVFKVTGVLNGVESSPTNKAFYGPYSVNETPQSLTRMFPNPTTGWVTFESESLKEVNVFNLNGQLVRRIHTSETVTEVDLSSLDSGVYYVRMVTEQGSQVKKLVLVK